MKDIFILLIWFLGSCFVIYILLFVIFFILSFKKPLYSFFRFRDPKIFYIFDILKITISDLRSRSKDYF